MLHRNYFGGILNLSLRLPKYGNVYEIIVESLVEYVEIHRKVFCVFLCFMAILFQV